MSQHPGPPREKPASSRNNPAAHSGKTRENSYEIKCLTSRKHFVKSIFRVCNAKFQPSNEVECLLMLQNHLAVDVIRVISNFFALLT